MARKEAPLTFEEYQEESRKTAIYPEVGKPYVYPALGLGGEAGEVIETLKKVLRDEEGEIDEATKENLKKELGDVLWYLSNLAEKLNLSLDEIAKKNLKKLASRQKRDVLHGKGDER